MNITYRLLSVFLFTLLLNTALSAQAVISGERIDASKYDQLWNKFEYFDLFELSAADIHEAVNSPAEDNVLALELGAYDWTMELYPDDMHANSVTITDEYGQTSSRKMQVISYRGQLKGNPYSRVDMTITDNMVLGMVHDGKNEYFIEKVRNIVDDAPFEEYIVYNVKSVLPNPEITCGMDEVHKKFEDTEIQNDQPESSMACYDVIVALATDARMATRHGGSFGAQGHVIGILTLVQTNYDDEFFHEINFVIGSHFNVSSTNPGAWNYSSIGALLTTFGNWANGNGFGTTAYDVATLWTGVSFGGTIGLAWVNALCGGNRYNICVDYTSGSNGLRNLQAHELGHNFSLTHDSPGSPHIMAPAVNGSNTWSSQSQGQMNSRIPFSCMGPCAGQNPPSPDFIGTPQSGCRPMVVNFTDLSSNNPTQWLWTFPGGTPSSSIQQNPTVTYPAPGTYDVTLEVSNVAGSNLEFKRNYISVGDIPIADFQANVILDEVLFQDRSIVYGAADYIWDFGDGEFSNDRNPNHTYDRDGQYLVTLRIETDCGDALIQKLVTIVTPPVAQFESDTTQLCTGTRITFTNLSSYNAETFKWVFQGGQPETSTAENPTVLYDSAGTFNVELLAQNSRYQDLEKKVKYIQVDTPATADFTEDIDADSLEVEFTNETENARTFKWLFGDGEMSNQENPAHEYDKDSIYEVQFITTNHCNVDTLIKSIAVGRLPKGGFTVDDTTGCLPHTVTFEDTSSMNTTRRIWKFEGGDPLTSNELNPEVTYDEAGEYKVTLIAINGIGNDTVIKEDYILIEDQPVSDFQFTRNGYEITFENDSEGATSYNWDFGDGENSNEEDPVHTYRADGMYEVTLVVSNGCGSDTIRKNVNISNQPNANFTADVFEGCVPMTVKLQNQSSTNTESVEWRIPGGNPSNTTEEDPEITFNNPGLYRVTLIAKNAFGEDTIEKRDFIEVLDVPEADYDFKLNGFNIEFTQKTRYGKEFIWEFGDGATSDLADPTHVYTDEGVYTVTLTVRNICGEDTYSRELTVTPRPVIEFSASATEICVGDTVYYMDNSSNNPTTWNWTFDGGDPAASTDQDPVVIYNTPGTYAVQLEASNQFGSNESTQSDYVTVYGDPMALFSAETNSTTVKLTNESEQIGTILWDFGDGETSNEKDPVHRYQHPGTYLITLTIQNACGESTYMTEVSVRYRDIDMVDLGPSPAPNPTSGLVTVGHNGQPSSSISIKVAGLNGHLQEVYRGDFSSGEMEEVLDLSFLTEGTYFLFFETEHQVRMAKLIIQK